MDDKVVISLISVATGWLLAQGTAFFKNLWAARKLTSGLLTELKDIQDQLERVILIHHRQLQIFAHKGIEPTAALPIENMYFKQYFKEAFSHLNRSQRLSYQIIHSSLESLNKKNKDLEKFTEETCAKLITFPHEPIALSSVNMWGDRVISLFKTGNDVRWHIQYHLRNLKSPTFDIYGAMHESYLKYDRELDEEVKLIIEGAKKFNKADFKNSSAGKP